MIRIVPSTIKSHQHCFERCPRIVPCRAVSGIYPSHHPRRAHSKGKFRMRNGSAQCTAGNPKVVNPTDSRTSISSMPLLKRWWGSLRISSPGLFLGTHQLPACYLVVLPPPDFLPTEVHSRTLHAARGSNMSRCLFEQSVTLHSVSSLPGNPATKQ